MTRDSRSINDHRSSEDRASATENDATVPSKTNDVGQTKTPSPKSTGKAKRMTKKRPLEFTCEQMQSVYIDRYVDLTLTAREDRHVRAHLMNCKECEDRWKLREALDELPKIMEWGFPNGTEGTVDGHPSRAELI